MKKQLGEAATKFSDEEKGLALPQGSQLLSLTSLSHTVCRLPSSHTDPMNTSQWYNCHNPPVSSPRSVSPASVICSFQAVSSSREPHTAPTQSQGSQMGQNIGLLSEGPLEPNPLGTADPALVPQRSSHGTGGGLMSMQQFRKKHVVQGLDLETTCRWMCCIH